MRKISNRYYNDNNSLIDRELSSIYKNLQIPTIQSIRISNLVSKFLNKKQSKISNTENYIKNKLPKTPKTQIQVNSYFNTIEKFPNYQEFNKKIKTKNSFIKINNILLNIISTFNPEITMFRDDILDKLIKYTHEQMAYKFRSIYQDCNYSIIKRIGDKYALETALLTNKSPYKHPLYEIFVCDYFRLNIALFDIETTKWKWYGRNTQSYKVLPIAKYKKTLYKSSNKIILNYNDFDITQYTLEDLKKMKLPSLQNIARDFSIKLQKKGKLKMINRTKKELIADIVKYT